MIRKEPPMSSPSNGFRFTIALLVMVAAACQGAPLASTSRGGTAAAPAQVAASAPPIAAGGPPPFVDVPMYRMDPTHQGVQPGPGPVGQPMLAWSVKAGAGISTSPVLGGGTLFIGSDDGNLYALDARTGADRWHLGLGAPAASAPVFGDGIVAIADSAGTVYGVDATTGSEVWHTAAVATGAAPALDRGTVYTTGRDHHAHGFDLRTGVERWSWATTGDLGNSIAIAGDVAYIGSQDGVLHAVALDGSKELWSYATIGTSVGVPIVSGDVVLVNSLQGSGEQSGELYALDRTSGTLLWRFRGPSGLQVTLGSVRDGILYAPTEADGIYAFHVADGTLAWQGAGPRVFFGTALVDDTLYLSSESPAEIEAVRASDGTRLWSLPVSEVPKGNPVVSGGMVFGSDASGEVRAYASGADVAGTPGSTPRPLNASAAPAAVSNPFTIVARYDTARLGLDRPIALAIGPNGDAYVTETGGRVSQIGADGTVVRRWGKQGSGLGEFDFVAPNPEDGAHASIAVGPDGKVYVSDSSNHRVQVFTADGTFIRAFGSYGTSPGQFVLPFDLSADAQGNVYVLDDGAVRLSKFGPDGAILWVIDETTTPLFAGHGHGARLDSQGRVVVGMDDSARILYLDPDGKVVDSFSAPACDVTIDAHDNLYAGGCDLKAIQVFDPSHGLVGSWPAPDMQLPAPPQFGPNGLVMALDQVGAIVELKVAMP
jgi:outer membrane protein assembly factor BamB